MAKFAIMGFGTVGGGVGEVMRRNGEMIGKKLGESLELKYILDICEIKDPYFADRVIRDFAIIENDPEIEVVVETIGGIGVAYEFTRRSLLAGKHVVTSNKELVATHGKELLKIAREKNVNYMFEASVGGGIPCLRPLIQCLEANEIEEIAGVLNGTTNYILTRMVDGGITFEAALKEAQAKGYAEADPSADVEGKDACRKICILSNLAWGKEVRPDQVSTEGISKLDLKDVTIAGGAGYRIKLLGRAMKLANGRQAAYVAPHLVASATPVSHVDDVFNTVMVRGNCVGDVMFYGRGAGDTPTASAVLGDVIDILQNHRNSNRGIMWDGEADVVNMETELPLYWYLRGEFAAPEGSEVLAEGAVIVGPMVQKEAETLAAGIGAVTLLPVYR